MSATLPPQSLALIPWYPTSFSHTPRMYSQRLSCGWRSEDVPEWATASISGTMNLFWLIPSPSLPTILSQHNSRFPHKVLIGSSSSSFLQPRQPSWLEIHPIGHIALSFPPTSELESLSLPLKDTAYISKVYVSWAVQFFGFGSEAVRGVEALARDLGVTTVYLDTVDKEYQMDRDLYLNLGIPFPKISSEEQYVKLSYEKFLRKRRRGIYLVTSPLEKGRL